MVCRLGFGTTTEDSTGDLDQDEADHAVTAAGKTHSDLKKSSQDDTLEASLFAMQNTDCESLLTLDMCGREAGCAQDL